MSEAEALLDSQLRNLNRVVLRHGGKVSSEDGVRHAKSQYASFDAKRRELCKIAADKALLEMKTAQEALPKPRRARKGKANPAGG